MGTKKMLLGSAFYSIGSMTGAGLNMIYQFALMLFLTIDDYGIIQPLLQLVGLLLLPITAYQFALTKHYASLTPDEIQNETLDTSRKSTLVTLVTTVIWIALIPFFKNVFHVDDTVIFILLLISILMHIIQVPYVSRLQAENRFFTAGCAQIAQGVARMSLGLLCVWKMPSVWGAMIGVLISNLAFISGNIFEYREKVFQKLPVNYKPKPFSLKLLFVSLGSVGLFSLLIYSDTVLVRAILPMDSALFASSNLLGKGMIFLTTGISFVVLPLMANKLHDSKKALWVGFACLLALVIFYNLFFFITAPILATVLFKDELTIFEQFKVFMPYYNLMFVPYPLIYYFLNYYLVKENPFYPFLLAIGTGFLYGGVFYFHDTIYTITNVIGVVGYSLLVIVIIHSLISKDEGAIHEERVDESAIENLV